MSDNPEQSGDSLALSAQPRGWRAVFPPAQWIPLYRPKWLLSDTVAGVTLAAYAIPVALAYASLAGLPPQSGIYCYLVGGLAYAVFGSSRQLAIGPTSAISLLVGSTIAGMAAGDPVRWAAIAALTALVVSAISVLAWLLRLSSLVSFISETVLLGFKAGAAVAIATTQLPKLFGVPGGGEHFFERVVILIGQLGETHVAVLVFGLFAIGLLIAGEKLWPGRPVALAVVALSIAILSLTSLESLGFRTVGQLPRGLPDLRLPSLRLRDIDGVIPLALACFLLAYIESVSAARALAEGRGDDVNPRQELLGLGAANFAAALGQGYPVAGGLSQSAVNDKAGAQTPLALAMASGTIAVCLVLLTDLVRNLPEVVLASIVLVAVLGLIDIREMRRLWRVSRMEFAVAMVALVGVLVLGILKGVLLAAVVSLLMLLWGAARPHVAFLGRIPGTTRYSDVERHPDNQRIAGALIFRVESSLLYFNVTHVYETVQEHLRSASTRPQLVVCDLSTSPYVDVAGARILVRLQEELDRSGIEFRLAEAHGAARDILRAVGLERQLGHISRRTSVDDVIRAFQPPDRTSSDPAVGPP